MRLRGPTVLTIARGAPYRLLRTNRRANLFDCINRIKADGICQIQKLNNVDPALAAFDRSYKRLITPQSLCELSLRQTRFLPLLNKQSDQGLLPRRSERSWHFLPQRQGGRQIIGFTDYLKTRYCEICRSWTMPLEFVRETVLWAENDEQFRFKNRCLNALRLLIRRALSLRLFKDAFNGSKDSMRRNSH
jgi:hypothetical protein